MGEVAKKKKVCLRPSRAGEKRGIGVGRLLGVTKKVKPRCGVNEHKSWRSTKYKAESS